jgi:hypothetical protein
VTDAATRARIGEATRARHAARRAALAERLRPMGGLTDREAARAVGVSTTTVRSVREQFALPRAADRTGEANRARHQQRRAALVARLETLGALTSAQAAAALGCSRTTVLLLRREHGLPGPRKPTRKGARGRSVADPPPSEGSS